MEMFMDQEKHLDLCTCTILHEEAVAIARSSEASTSVLLATAELFKVFSDPTRLRILNALAVSELCVCDLSAALDMSQSSMSHQLALLRRARLVRPRREGKAVFYSLDDEHVRDILRVASVHLDERKGA